MNVKKGTASSVSFCMMPNTRRVRAWNNVGGNSPASMPMRPKVSPVAARLKTTGKPVSRNTSKPLKLHIISNLLARFYSLVSELR
jgi:hypothetical protein